MKSFFPFELNVQQNKVFDSLKLFVQSRNNKIFILKGYAGTGKTTLMSGLIKYLEHIKKPFELLSSTGRAAKILSDLSGHRASTIHSHIYSFSDLSNDVEEIHNNRITNNTKKEPSLNLLFELNQIDQDESKKMKIYIIDEASMIANEKNKTLSFAKFGEGELLKDLIEFDPNGKFLFLGDPCQLPPVNQIKSPALDKSYLEKTFKCNVEERMLTKIVRQEGDNNGIINASLSLRKMFFNPPSTKWPKIPLGRSADIKILDSDFQLINLYLQEIKENGSKSATLLAQSNKNCKELNDYVRSKIFKDTSSIQKNDLLLITQNNAKVSLVNGDLVKVRKIEWKENRCGLSFYDAELEELSTKRIMNSLLINDIPYSNATQINEEKHRDLMVDYYVRMKEKGIHYQSKEFKDNMLEDPFLNAIKSVFGYALTCHKAQGGEWNKVFLYMNTKTYGPFFDRVKEITKPSFFQWSYTSITRAKKQLYVVKDWYIG